MSGIFEHVKDGHESLVNAARFPEPIKSIPWVRFGDKSWSITVDLDKIGTLLSTANISRQEAKLISAELTRAYAVRDRVSFTYCVHYLQASSGVGGKRSHQIIQLIGSATKKIMENVQMSRRQRIWTGGRGGKQQEKLEESGYDTTGYPGGQDEY